MYYLNVLAGPGQRSMAFCDDPVHAWQRATWDGLLSTHGSDDLRRRTREELPMTVRLTTAQALVRWLVAQRSELLDGTEVPLFPGVFGIFGHGNVLGLGTALHEVRDQLPTWRGQTEQGMALAAAAFARATDRRQVMVATSSIGPGALNMVTAAGLAHANRLPLLLLPGDTFTGRGPDPVLQQVEHFDDPTTSVNDAFRAVARYVDRITTPEQLLATLPQVARVLTDPADTGPVVLALPQDVQVQELDFPEAMFAPRLHRVPRPRPDTRRWPTRCRCCARPGVRSWWSAAVCATRGGPRAGRTGGGTRRTGRGDARGADGDRARPPAARRPAGHHRLRVGQHAGRGGGRRGGRRHAAAGLHHRVLDAVRRRRAGHHRQCRAVRRREAQRSGGGRRRAGGRRGAGLRRWPAGGSTRSGRHGPPPSARCGTRTWTACARAWRRTGR
jgi:hypothetical protein